MEDMSSTWSLCIPLLVHGKDMVTLTMTMTMTVMITIAVAVMMDLKMIQDMSPTCPACSSLLAHGKHMDWKHLKSATSPPNPVTAAQSESVTQAGKALMSLV